MRVSALGNILNMGHHVEGSSGHCCPGRWVASEARDYYIKPEMEANMKKTMGEANLQRSDGVRMPVPILATFHSS